LFAWEGRTTPHQFERLQEAVVRYLAYNATGIEQCFLPEINLVLIDKALYKQSSDTPYKYKNRHALSVEWLNVRQTRPGTAKY
jgi:hypothetical protein